MDVESRLSAYRRVRKNKETLDEVKNYIATPFSLFRNKMRTLFAHPAGGAEACEEEVKTYSSPFTRQQKRKETLGEVRENEPCGEEVKTYSSPFTRQQKRKEALGELKKYGPCGEEVKTYSSPFTRQQKRKEALGELKKYGPCGEEVKTYSSPFTRQQKRKEALKKYEPCGKEVKTYRSAFKREYKRRVALGEVRKYEPTQFNLLRKEIRATFARPVAKKDSRVIKRHELQVKEKEAEAEPLLEEEDDDVYSSVDDISTEGDDMKEVNKNLMGLRGVPKYLAYFVLWLIPYLLLIKAGFGAVYFCVTALLFVYYNTRTGPKLRNEPSAYSVFNKGCAPIDGAVSSEQLEKQLRSGMLN